MTLFLDYLRKKAGWCPNASACSTAPAVMATPLVLTPPVPAGGATGSGRMDRGFSLVFGSILVLARNLRLFWFSLLLGIVTLFTLVSTMGIQYFSGTDPLSGQVLATGPASVLVAKGSVTWFMLIYAGNFAGVLCSLFLFAGLAFCVSHLLNGHSIPVSESLGYAGGLWRPIIFLSVVLASVGTINSVVMYLYPTNLVFSSAVGFCFMPVSLVLFLAVPALVNGEEKIQSAIRASLSVIRRTWGEILMVCFIFGLFFMAISFVLMLPMITVGFPSGAGGLLTAMLALYLFGMSLALVIGWTVLGIAALGLYSCAMTGALPPGFIDNP